METALLRVLLGLRSQCHQTDPAILRERPCLPFTERRPQVPGPQRHVG
jgi:hypothetical protein